MKRMIFGTMIVTAFIVGGLVWNNQVSNSDYLTEDWWLDSSS